MPRLDERARYARALIDAGRIIHSQLLAPNGGSSFGREVDLILILLAVKIGDAENRPMTETKLSHFVDMPRATVQRKLEALIKRGVVVRRDGGVYRLSERTRTSSQHVDRVLAAMMKAYLHSDMR